MFLLTEKEILIRRGLSLKKVLNVIAISLCVCVSHRSSGVPGGVSCPDGDVSLPVHPHTALPLPATGTGSPAIFGRGVWTDTLHTTLQSPCSAQEMKLTFSTWSKVVWYIEKENLIIPSFFVLQKLSCVLWRNKQGYYSKLDMEALSSNKTNVRADLSLWGKRVVQPITVEQIGILDLEICKVIRHG